MQVIKVSVSVISVGLHSAKTSSNNIVYYIFKIFPCFWLVKTTHIIHHNQLLLTKFGKNFVILNQWPQNDVKSAAFCRLLTHWPRKPGDKIELFWELEQNGATVAEHFTRFTAKYCLKTSQEQQEGISTDNIWSLEYIFADLSKPLIS